MLRNRFRKAVNKRFKKYNKIIKNKFFFNIILSKSLVIDKC